MERMEWRQFDLTQLEELGTLPRKKGNPGHKHSTIYADTFATFDIETSTIIFKGKKHAICYVWMFYLPKYDVMLTGRSIIDFRVFCWHLQQHLKSTLCVYVHNLSFEFQQLAGVYDFKGYGDESEVFAVKSRKVVKCSMFCRIEFRCSAILSNMSLALYTKKYNVKHQKLSGEEYDYKKIRYPWTPLTDREWEYCTNDVVGLAECIQVELGLDGFTLATIPITSTGFVRADLKRAMRSISHTLVPDLQPDYHVYTLLRRSFIGGCVHANRYYANQILQDVNSFDRSSSYPDVLCNCKFPMSAWSQVEDCDLEKLAWIKSRGRAFVVQIYCTDVRLRNPRWPVPCLSYDKCEISTFNRDLTRLDNGRVLECPELITTMTDVDFDIFLQEYECNIAVIECYSSRYGLLPWPYVETIKEYYKAKTRLKGVEEMVAFYEKSKGKINACFGCAAQDPVSPDQYFIDGEWKDGFSLDIICELKQTKEERYAEAIKKAWSTYAWGVWCTAWARYRLFEGICIASAELPHQNARKENATSDFVYCDTDSVKFLGAADFSAYNAERMEASINTGAFADDPKGKRHYMGVFEEDGTYKEFITLGAKKYAYIKPKTEKKIYHFKMLIGRSFYHRRIRYKLRRGTLGITISGISKKKGAVELQRKGGLKALVDAVTGRGVPVIFREAGGTALIYNDARFYGLLEKDGHRLPITRNVVIADDTTRVGMPVEYYLLLNACKKELDG